MRMEREIAILKDLVRATCHSADISAAATRAATDPYWSMLLEQVREDHRLLLVDLVRCLLLRGQSEASVRGAMTEVLAPAAPDEDFGLLRLDLEIAERKLELTLRRVLADAGISQPTLELLSLHYLRLKLRLKDLETMAGQEDGDGFAVAPALAATAWSATAVAAPKGGLLH